MFNKDLTVFGTDVEFKVVLAYLFRKLYESLNLIFSSIKLNGRHQVRIRMVFTGIFRHSQNIWKILQDRSSGNQKKREEDSLSER
jgi:hypothetical protein